MKSRVASWWVITVLLILFTSSGGEAGQKLTILFTHDLHSYFLPQREAGALGERGGYARIASLISERRAQGGDCVLVVDAGDFSMGTLFHTLFTREAAELVTMTDMGYDVLTLGNHEFDFGPEKLAQALLVARSRRPQPPAIVASNLSLEPAVPHDALIRRAVREYPIKPYVVITKGQIRIGVLGF